MQREILIIYRSGARGFGVIFPEVMIFSESPEENIITEGNIAESPERRVYK
jgi:hypothetical protein